MVRRHAFSNAHCLFAALTKAAREIWRDINALEERADWSSPVSLLGPAGQTGNTVWVQLPMADMEFRGFRRHKDEEYAAGKGWVNFPKGLDAVLYMRVRADTGMPTKARNDPNPLKFVPAELCQSKLFLFIVLNRIERGYSCHFWDASTACREIEPGKSTEHPTVQGFSIFGQDVDLAALPDEDSLVGWIEQFREAAETALGVKFSDLPNA